MGAGLCAHVCACVHVLECVHVCVLMIEERYYLAASMPQGEMTAGYAHVGEEEEREVERGGEVGATLDVPECYSRADRASLHSHHPTSLFNPHPPPCQPHSN